MWISHAPHFDALGSRLAPWLPPPFAWPAWHWATWTVTLRGRRGTSRHRSSLYVAGVALRDIDRHFAWQASAWHLYGTGLAPVTRLGGHRRRFTGRHRPSLCVAGLALRDIDRHFAWQAWHLWHWAGSRDALGSCLAPWSLPPFEWQAGHSATWTCILRGRRGTSRPRLSLCVWTCILRGRRRLKLRCVCLRNFSVFLFFFMFMFMFMPFFPTSLCGVLVHTIFHHTIFHTQLCHTPSFATPSSHALFHTHTIFHTQLCHTHTPSFFVTHHLSHTTLSHTTLHIQLVLLLAPPPPPLSFLPSPSPLQHLLLIIGRS